jgi:Tfp pilus assembly protein PilF
MKPNTNLTVVAVMLLLGLILSYSNHFRNGFHFDDSHTIVNNAYITDVANIPRFFADARTFSTLPANQAYRPVVTTLNAIDYRLGGGLNPVTFHLSIFIAYVLQLAVMFFVFKRIFDLALPTAWNAWIALFGVAIYGFHTANAETINYIISRSDSFSTLCVVASFLLYQIPSTRRLHLYLLTMIVGIYTKQTAVMFAPLLFLYVLILEEPRPAPRGVGGRLRRFGFAIRRALPSFVVGGGLFLVNQLFLTPKSTVSTNVTVGRLDYLITQLHVVAHYLGNFVLPTHLSADPDIAVITDFGDGRVRFGLIVVAALLAVALFSLRAGATRPIGFGVLWFFTALAPTSTVIPLYQIANDHRTFFPYVGLTLGLSSALGLIAMRHAGTISRRPALRYGVPLLAVVTIAGLAYGVHQRNRVWSSSEALWRDATVKSPRNGRAMMNYGLTQMRAGNYEVALDYFERGLALLPGYSYLHVNLGILKNAMGKPVEAEPCFQTALRLDPRNPEVYYYYAEWLAERGRRGEAIRLLRTGLETSPGHVRVRSLLGTLERGQRASEDARIAGLLASAEAEPTAENYVELSLAYYDAARYRECIEACRNALRLRPGYAIAYNNICSAYNQLEEWDAAREACEKAIELAPDFERARANLRWAEDGKARKTPAPAAPR